MPRRATFRQRRGCGIMAAPAAEEQRTIYATAHDD
jgi:hypothetical protein